MSVNLTMQWAEGFEEEDVGEDVGGEEKVEMVRVHFKGQLYEYRRQVFMEHLQAHSKLHILYKKIARQLPNGSWILCDDTAILADYTAFALQEMNNDWKTCSMDCYTADQYENFMYPGLRLELPPDTSAQFFAEVKQRIQASIEKIPLSERVHLK
jgi:hypothetical protein